MHLQYVVMRISDRGSVKTVIFHADLFSNRRILASTGSVVDSRLKFQTATHISYPTDSTSHGQMPSSIASPQHHHRRINNSPPAGRRVAAQNEMLRCPCGTTLEKSSYRRHRYRSLQHVDYIIALCIERDAEVDARAESANELKRKRGRG